MSGGGHGWWRAWVVVGAQGQPILLGARDAGGEARGSRGSRHALLKLKGVLVQRALGKHARAQLWLYSW